MTWTNTTPSIINYYHVPQKDLRPISKTLDPYQSTILRLWIPRDRYEFGDHYHPSQRGHLTMITFRDHNHGVNTDYELHQTEKTITATFSGPDAERPMTIQEIENLATIVRQELKDYNKPKTIFGKAIEAVTHYRRRTQERLQDDLNNILDDYYRQEAGKTITIQ